MNLLAPVLTVLVSVNQGVTPLVVQYPQVIEEHAIMYSEIRCEWFNRSFRYDHYSTMVTIQYEDGSWEPGNGRWYTIKTYITNRCMV